MQRGGFHFVVCAGIALLPCLSYANTGHEFPSSAITTSETAAESAPVDVEDFYERILGSMEKEFSDPTERAEFRSAGQFFLNGTEPRKAISLEMAIAIRTALEQALIAAMSFEQTELAAGIKTGLLKTKAQINSLSRGSEEREPASTEKEEANRLASALTELLKRPETNSRAEELVSRLFAKELPAIQKAYEEFIEKADAMDIDELAALKDLKQIGNAIRFLLGDTTQQKPNRIQLIAARRALLVKRNELGLTGHDAIDVDKAIQKATRILDGGDATNGRNKMPAEKTIAGQITEAITKVLPALPQVIANPIAEFLQTPATPAATPGETATGNALANVFLNAGKTGTTLPAVSKTEEKAKPALPASMPTTPDKAEQAARQELEAKIAEISRRTSPHTLEKGALPPSLPGTASKRLALAPERSMEPKGAGVIAPSERVTATPTKIPTGGLPRSGLKSSTFKAATDQAKPTFKKPSFTSAASWGATPQISSASSRPKPRAVASAAPPQSSFAGVKKPAFDRSSDSAWGERRQNTSANALYSPTAPAFSVSQTGSVSTGGAAWKEETSAPRPTLSQPAVSSTNKLEEATAGLAPIIQRFTDELMGKARTWISGESEEEIEEELESGSDPLKKKKKSLTTAEAAALAVRGALKEALRSTLINVRPYNPPSLLPKKGQDRYIAVNLPSREPSSTKPALKSDLGAFLQKPHKNLN